MSTLHHNQESINLLEDIKSLKFSHLKREEFWKVFLENIVKLHNAPFSLLLNEKDGQWSLDANYGLQKYEDEIQEILKFSVSIASRALNNGFSYERVREKWSNSKSLMGVAIKMDALDESLVLFVCFEHENTLAFNNSVARLKIFSDLYLAYKKNNSQLDISSNLEINEKMSPKIEPFRDVVEIVSLLIYQKKFLLASMTLVNELATRFNCSKVSLGWRRKEYVEAIALSHREDFIRKSEVINKLEFVYEECFDQDIEIHYPHVDDEFVITHAHEEYYEDNKTQDLLSLPLRVDIDVKGVILFEKNEEEFSEEELLGLRLIINQVTPILDTLYVQDKNFFARIKYKFKEHLSWWLGVNDTITKFVVIATFATLVSISTIDMQYKIEAQGAITTDNISFVSTPYDSRVYEVSVHSGDIVNKEDVLLQLDTRELYLKYSEALADVSRYSMEEQKFRGVNKLADMQIARAKMEQAIATQERLKYYLEQSTIKSSIDGFIVEGDHEELLGKPVSKGDMLFQIAQLSDFYLTLDVSEEYINELEVGGKGQFVFLGKTAEKIDFTIEKIIPLAKVDGAKNNSFKVKALLKKEAAPWWRPGMSGVAKLYAGERKIVWVLTHKLVDFLRLFFWI